MTRKIKLVFFRSVEVTLLNIAEDIKKKKIS